MSKSSSFLAFISGAAVGAVLGVLYAPDKGSNTRDKLLYMLNKYKAELQEMINEIMEGEAENYSEAKQEGKKVITDAREKAEKLLEDVDDLIGQIKSKKK
ncbi:MAG: YtxH domain-containing protein [Cyclobacteriaceae bacterium]|nr:YtxH domain-containing protein [Cyclobacteriaceae bacterium]